jgi:hypothetical protein
MRNAGRALLALGLLGGPVAAQQDEPPEETHFFRFPECIPPSTSGDEMSERRNKLPDGVVDLLAAADHLELLSLDQWCPCLRMEPDDPAGFHGWRILGRTTLRKASERHALLAALKQQLPETDRPPHFVAMCFNPRHGIRATSPGGSVDLVVCFECYQLDVFPEGPCAHVYMTGRGPSAQPTFDKILRKARVRLPPGAGEEHPR